MDIRRRRLVKAGTTWESASESVNHGAFTNRLHMAVLHSLLEQNLLTRTEFEECARRITQRD